MEISLHLKHDEGLKLMERLARHTWWDKITNTLGLIINNVLNDRTIVQLAYKSLSIPQLLWNLGKVDNNSLIIGKENCWLVVAKTCHANHFLGTERKISHKSTGYDCMRWDRIQDLLLKHATPGATVEIHLLSPHVPQIKPVTVVKKAQVS